MRYLKIYAQDVLDDDVPDVVYLEFHDDTRTPTISHSATAFDITDDGKLDWIIADDVNQDGVIDAVDRAQAIELAQLFLEFNWYSLDEPFDKYLQVFARDFDDNGVPDTVRLHFHQGAGAPCDESLVYTAALYADGNGQGATAIYQDVNNDQKVDKRDAELVRKFSTLFLAFGWIDAEHC